MKRYLTAIIIIILMSHVSRAQMPRKNPEEAVRFLADKLLSTTSWELMNYETGDTFHESENLPVDGNIKVKCKVTDWRYDNGLLNMAMLKLGQYLGENKYIDFAKNNYEFAFRHYDYFKKQFEDKSINRPSMSKLYEFHYLDDCGTMGAGLIDSYNLMDSKNKHYENVIDRSADYIMNREFRLKDGTFCREYPRKGAVWADDLYMSVVFLAKMGEFSGQTKYHDEAIRQIVNFTNYLMDDHLNIYHHAYLDDIQETNGAFWGRANGWVMMAQVELLSVLPENHPKREELLTIFKKFVAGIARQQSSNGLWHQLLNKNDSFLESSCTAMFTYSIAKAVNEGWIDGVWSQVAWKGWQGLYENITEDAQVKDICVGTHVEWNLAFYYHRPISVNDTHGLASALLAGAEIDRMSKKYDKKVNPRSF